MGSLAGAAELVREPSLKILSPKWLSNCLMQFHKDLKKPKARALAEALLDDPATANTISIRYSF